ncbi:hypothetical protein E3P77_03544 [Wallemia ichthyophaga]|uniref:Protein MPE1 n=1 Tax=Wallemia ichthyophaga TaxID=245174 RepID=A0A4V4M646_WALIC|nr:hypothetical protein E3P91_03583 [Wallemia ichthyophaga]TIA79244.1 hypothetical protein E3P98_03405 [Wallemia ichthyophaga]TIB30003.1 hypothetical protein E3P84_03484 [Wallemia ichthyophaga]TIB37954.1 hypothetical protein E3P86_01954 [Wallemia ichthyophaga]TIB63375.1 hypothetical protein E3P77_03544 [Wallemia ichthyophaga]
MGSIYYKFKSSKITSRVNIDGTSLSVFDLKREILLSNRMAINKGNDFDLILLRDTPGQEEYHDDNEMIPRSTSVLVKRSPPKIPNRGSAAKYTADAPVMADSNSSQPKPPLPVLGSMSKRFDGKDENKSQQLLNQSSESGQQESEQDAISAMFKASEQQWEETQQHMSMATPVYTNMRPQVRKPIPQPTATGDSAPSTSQPQPQSQPQESSMSNAMPTPPGYVCYRCGEKGHWIQDCPTNGDPNYENKPRFKRTTGIPKSFLKTVDPSTAALMTNNGTNNSQGVMITPDGSHVIATPDIATWEKSRSIKSSKLTVNDIRDSEPKLQELKCGLSGKLLNNPVTLPCCNLSFSDDYINHYLIENDLFCPNCHSNVGSLENLKSDLELKQKVIEYINEELRLDKLKRDENNKDGDSNNQTDSSDDTQKDHFQQADRRSLFHDDIIKVNKIIHDCQFAIMAIFEALKNNELDDKTKYKFQTQLVQINQIMNLQQGQVMMMMNGMDPKVFGMPLLPQINQKEQQDINQTKITEPSTGQKRQNDDDNYNNERPSKR